MKKNNTKGNTGSFGSWEDDEWGEPYFLERTSEVNLPLLVLVEVCMLEQFDKRILACGYDGDKLREWAKKHYPELGWDSMLDSWLEIEDDVPFISKE